MSKELISSMPVAERFNVTSTPDQSPEIPVFENPYYLPLGAHLAFDTQGGQFNIPPNKSAPRDPWKSNAETIETLAIQGDIMGVKKSRLDRGFIEPVDESLISEGSISLRNNKAFKDMSDKDRVDLLITAYEVPEFYTEDLQENIVIIKNVCSTLFAHPELYADYASLSMFTGFTNRVIEIKEAIEGKSDKKKANLYLLIQELDSEEKTQLQNKNLQEGTRVEKSLQHPVWGQVMQIIMADLTKAYTNEVTTKKLVSQEVSIQAPAPDVSELETVQMPAIKPSQDSQIDKWFKIHRKKR